MPASLVNADSLLALDIGSVTTRAALFDVVEGHYRFIASGQAPTTAAAPIRDVTEGARQAIDNLQMVTGRKFLDDDQLLIMPPVDGAGVDTFTATLSAGPAIRTAVLGLLEGVSLESIQRLARTTYTSVVETIGLNDARKPEVQIDSLLHLKPDLILIAGGTDGGAERSLRRLIEIVGLSCYLMPDDKRPTVLFAGNQSLAAEIQKTLEPVTSSISVSPNLRPGVDTEDLQPAQHALGDLYTSVRSRQMKGVDEVYNWSWKTLMPTASAIGRVVRFLSQIYDSSKGILGVDLGASAATVAASFGGELTLGVYPQLGLGEGLASLLRYTSLDDILKWIPLEIPADTVRDYLYQKSLYPMSLPATPEDQTIEQAVARQCLYVAMKSAGKDFSKRARRAAAGLTSYFEPILAAGSVITRAPTFGQSLLILLDAIQPVGITNLVLDQNNLLPGLGAAATRNSILSIQVLESGAFLGLATVVSPYVNARPGTPIMSARLQLQNGSESRVDVKQGALEVLPLPIGQTGRLYLTPHHHADLGFGPGLARDGGVAVSGTAVGVVIDARGRPLRLPADQAKRRETLKKWLWTLGG